MFLSYRNRYRHKALAWLAIVCLVANASQARTTVGFDASAKIESNPLLLNGQDNSAAVFDLSVLPEFKDGDGRGNNTDVAGVLTVREYSRRYSHAILGSLTGTREFRKSEKLSGKASVGLARDLVGDTPTVGADALVSPQSLRTTLNGMGQLEWRPDDVTTITPEVSALRSTYDRTSLLRKVSSAEARLAYARKTSSTTWIGIRPQFEVSHTQGEPTLQRYAIYGTIQKRLSPVLQLNFDLGAEHLPRADAVGLATTPRSAETFLAGTLRLCAKASRLDACLNAELGSQVSALEGFQRSKSVGANVSYHLDERKTVTAELDYQRVKAPVSLGQHGELEAAAASITLDWRVASKLTVSGVVGYALRQEETDSKPHSTYAGIRLRLTPRQE